MKKTDKFESKAQGLGYLFPQDFSRTFVKLQEEKAVAAAPSEG